MRIFSKLKFRTKLVLGITCIVVFTALLLSYVITRMSSQALIEENKKRGRVLTTNLSVRVADSMLAEDILRLKNMVDELVQVDDIEYAFILNSQGSVLVHSFNIGFPRQLSTVHKTPEQGVSIMLLDTGNQLIYDFAAPVIISEYIFGAVRIGLSRTKIQEVVNKLVLTIVGLSGGALVLAIIVSAVFGRQVTLRLNKLREHAEEVVKGNLDMQTGPALVKNCWDIMNCNLPQCPAYGDARRRCWYLAGTLCPECDEGSVEVKHESCKHCVVFRLNKGDEIQDLAETFDVMALTLKAHLDELKEAEQVLLRQKQLMGTILDVTPDFVCLLDENLVYLAVNKAYADFVGVEPAAIIGRKDANIFHTDNLYTMMSSESNDVIQTGKTSHQEIHFTKDGSEFWLHVVKVPVYDRSGRIIGLLRTARNITQLKQYQAQLIQSQKMESVGKLAGGVAHEINTPLGVILGYAQLLQEDVPVDSQIRKDLTIIEKQAKVCRKIVADLLGFSRQTESSKRDICFNNTLMEVVSLVAHTFSLDRVTLSMDLDDRLPVISADPEKLKQVWINLLNNARDAMDGGGAIYIKSRLNSPRQKVTVWVADSGVGISPDDLKRIFDPFFSTKPVGRGTGLGLSVSFGIIEDHGGTIYALSPAPPELHPRNAPGILIDLNVEMGPGTVFVVELPLDYDGAEAKNNLRSLE